MRVPCPVRSPRSLVRVDENPPHGDVQTVVQLQNESGANIRTMKVLDDLLARAHEHRQLTRLGDHIVMVPKGCQRRLNVPLGAPNVQFEL